MTKPQKKKKRTKSVRLEEIELLPDAWERFEKGVHQIAKATPKKIGSEVGAKKRKESC